MHRTFKVACLAALLALSGCSAFKTPKNQPVELVDFKQTMAIKTVWSAHVGDAGNFVFSPAYVEDSIITAASNGKVVRLNSATGREIWSVDADMPLTAGVGADSSTIAVVGDKGMVLAYDINGKLRWKVQASSEVMSSPVVGEDLVVVRSMDNHIAAYEVATGKRRWLIERPLPSLILRSPIGMTIYDHNIYIGLPGGKLISVALTSGSVRWEATVGEPKGATELERVADVSGVPVVYGGDVCAAAYQGKVSCYDLRNGVMRWGKANSTSMGVAVDERFVFAVDDKGTLNAFSRAAGLSEWKNEQLSYRKLSAPISVGQAVAVGDYKGYIHFMSREDGKLVARTSTDGGEVVAAPILAGNNVVFQTKSGEVIAIAIE